MLNVFIVVEVTRCTFRNIKPQITSHLDRNAALGSRKTPFPRQILQDVDE